MPHAEFMADMTTNAAAPDPFRAWGQQLSAALATVGLTKVPSVGEIDWATVAVPSTTHTAAGFEVWAFADDLQATHPVYVRLEYGHATVQQPALWVTVGKSVDANGVIGGVLVSRKQCGNIGGGSGASSTATTLVATCPGRACMIVVVGSDSTVLVELPAFMIERSRTNAGEPTGDGITVAISSGSNTPLTTLTAPPNTLYGVAYASGQANAGAVPAPFPFTIAGAAVGGGSSLASGVLAPAIPWLAYAPGLAPWQPLSAISYLEGDAVAGVVTVRVGGADRRYRVIPVSGAHHGWGVGLRGHAEGAALQAHPRIGVMILWED